MRKMKILFILSTLYCCSLSIYAEPTPVKTETFLHKILRISGIIATPQTMRGEEQGDPGQIWVVNIETNTQIQVSSNNEFRSPVFLPDDSGLLALKHNQLFEFSLPDLTPKSLFQIPGIIKIIGFDQTDKNCFLILLQDNKLELVSLTTGLRENLTYPPGEQSEKFLAHVKSWARDYGDKRVYIKTRRKSTLRGKRSYSNVYFQHDNQARNISQCKKSSCSQPSLSYDATQVVFIKSTSD